MIRLLCGVYYDAAEIHRRFRATGVRRGRCRFFCCRGLSISRVILRYGQIHRRFRVRGTEFVEIFFCFVFCCWLDLAFFAGYITTRPKFTTAASEGRSSSRYFWDFGVITRYQVYSRVCPRDVHMSSSMYPGITSITPLKVRPDSRIGDTLLEFRLVYLLVCVQCISKRDSLVWYPGTPRVYTRV